VRQKDKWLSSLQLSAGARRSLSVSPDSVYDFIGLHVYMKCLLPLLARKKHDIDG